MPSLLWSESPHLFAANFGGAAGTFGWLLTVRKFPPRCSKPPGCAYCKELVTLPAVVPVAGAVAAVAVGVSRTVPARSASPPGQARRGAVLPPAVFPLCSLVSSGTAAAARLPA